MISQWSPNCCAVVHKLPNNCFVDFVKLVFDVIKAARYLVSRRNVKTQQSHAENSVSVRSAP